MASKCFVSGCSSKPYGKCDCSEDYTIFCQYHSTKHMQILDGDKRHRCLRLYYTPAAEIKILVKKKIAELRQGLQKYRKNVILDAKEIIGAVKNNLEKALQSLDKLEEKFLRIALMTEFNEILDLSKENDPESVLKMEPYVADFETKDWYFPDFISKTESLVSNISICFNANIDPFQRPKPDINRMQDDKYIFFKGNSNKELSEINLKTFQETKLNLDLIENIPFQISSCILPDKSVFYYSNPNSLTSTYTFIIDKNKNIKQVANSKVSRYLYPIYFDGFVYALGGQNNLAQRFCLKSNTWEDCAPLPTGLSFHQTAAILFNEEILLTGYYLTKMIKYSPKNNNYSDIVGLNLTQSVYKILFKGDKKAFILQTSGNIFESEENNVNKWNLIGNNNIPSNYAPTTYVIEYHGCIYMILLINQLWEFNLSTKQLRLVNTYS
ncbi:unnamed protein product [Blepharisma stoltei]|uniref:Uncharacterized protein n=1 Tax=Blepharisma stoltei TaxID=1481888 RepID=A0AAU9IIQ5_9CILI|nr:unnamed protein product [Blepharisma stoltei]